MERLSVTLEEIDEQRAKGWPDFHPEDFCHRCGGKNVRSWYSDNDRWNTALGSLKTGVNYNGIICPGCFVQLHESATGLQITWKLIPDPQQSFRPLDNV